MFQLTFHILFLENNQYCSWDWIKIYDATNYTELRQLCGHIRQDLILTFNTSSIVVQFHSDSVSQRRGFLASWKPVSPESKDEEDKVEKEGYMLTLPQSFTASDETSPEEMCLEVFNVESKGKIVINVFSSENVINENTDIFKEIEYVPEVNGDKLQCFNMKLPTSFKENHAILQIKGTFDDSDYRILSYKAIQVLKVSVQTLIQTDKHEYRPKQLVQFRVLTMNGDLRPSKNNVLNEVYVKSPSRQVLAQFKDVELDPRGIGHFEYLLDEEPELGPWEISVITNGVDDLDSSIDVASFIVNEAVLPKFEVQINGPDVILSESEEVDFEICGIYTHGSKVKGSVEVTFEHTYRKANYWRAPSISSNYTKKAVISEDDSCTTVSINNTELAQLSIQKEIPFLITAKLTEEGTEIVQETSQHEKVIFTHAEFDFGDSSLEHIIGQFPYVMFFKLQEHASKKPIKGASVEICSRLWKDVKDFPQHINSRQFYSFDEDDYFDLGKKLIDIKFKETCIKQRTSDEDGSITFGIPLNGVPDNVTKLSVKVTALDFEANETTRMKLTQSKHDVTLTHLSNDTIGRDAHRLTIREKLIEDKKVKFDCEGTSEFTVYFQGQMGTTVDLNYVVSSGGSLIVSGNHLVSVDSNDTSKYLEGLIQMDELGYVNSSMDSSDNVLKTFVISLNRPFPQEGKRGKLLVMLGSTSQNLVPKKPKIEWVPQETNPGQSISLKIKYKPKSLCAYSVIDKSADLIENPNKVTTGKIQEVREELAKKRISMEDLGLFIMSDKLIQDPSCSSVVDSDQFDDIDSTYQYKPIPVAFSAAASPQSGFGSVDRLESDIVGPTSNKQGQVLLSVQEQDVKIRDYFPETWLFEIVDLEEEVEATVEKKTPHTITTWVADAFCSNLETGFSVAERSELKVNATVFNKVEGPLPMKLSIEASEEYSVVNKSEEFICVNPGGNVPIDLYIKLNKLGKVNLTVKAEIVEDESCGGVSKESVGYADTLVKSINKDLALEDTILPETNLVDDSNLDGLVALPTGCGEQTMIRMVPNIYLLDYLKSIGKSLPSLESKAKGYIQTGYDRQNRKFRHRDGGYSIWGPKSSEEEGSMWLTAYVVKAFSQASKYIDVDMKLLQKSVKWIIKRQDFETGCFHNEGYAYSVNSPRETLTSHVLVTLFEAKYTADLGDSIDSKVIHKALRCIKVSQTEKDTEESGDSPDESIEEMDDLKKLDQDEIGEEFEEIKGVGLFKDLMKESKTNDKGYLYWQTNNSLSRSVEMTAYNVMTLLFNDELIDALSAIRWISGHRNGKSMYSTMVYENDTSLNIQFSNKTSEIDTFDIDEDNKLLFNRIKIDNLHDLKVNSTGKGCYTFSTIVRYNVKEEKDENAKFLIRAEANKTTLHICSSYIGDKLETNMVLLEVELLSGYDIVESSLEVLLNELESGVEKYEINKDERKFVLYFNGLKKEENHCWNFEVKEVSQVENLRPALIKIFDYYSQEDVFTTTYNIE
ncbi:unnamed protein product [Lepeophtheirus salmonis]|uniref:(salmon louse) hypothetical protein n=1 Tax=Lepeophtheirus salmonis TaxID=72036 RepID=A0A7R8H384_LEPSM|nr:unnamed protein product [Lepeophtheirus salmonis]CAF2827217.1 unnamed protein product [Lepeophtheirus salmonis]